MIGATVAFVILFDCVCSIPDPRNIEVTLIRDSIVGYDLGAGDKQAKGVLEGTRTLDIDIPDEAADKAPEIILLENVNSGLGIALGAEFDVDKIISIKDQIFAGKNPFWKKK